MYYCHAGHHLEVPLIHGTHRQMLDKIAYFKTNLGSDIRYSAIKLCTVVLTLPGTNQIHDYFDNFFYLYQIINQSTCKTESTL